MAFDINYIGRVSSGANNEVQKVWVYNGSSTGSNEAIATIAASGYFNNFMVNVTGGYGPLSVNDLIYIIGNDASQFYTVTAITTNVTVSAFSTSGLVGTANIDADAVTNAKIADDAVSLENLDAGITPSHIVVFAGQPTTAGGAAAEAITVTGAAATDLAFVQMVNNGTNNTTIISAVVTLNTLTVTFSADPGADAVINYQLLRAAA